MAYYPLYDKQKQMALSTANLDKRVFEMNKRFARNFETELKQSSSPIPPHVKVEYLNLIDKCVTELEYIVENTDVYGVFNDKIGSLNSRDFRKYFKTLALYYKTYIYPYLNQDKVLQMNSLRALSQLSTLLEQTIGIAETANFTDKTFLKKALVTLNKMMNNIDLDYNDLNNVDISKLQMKQMKDMNIQTEPSYNQNSQPKENKEISIQTDDIQNENEEYEDEEEYEDDEGEYEDDEDEEDTKEIGVQAVPETNEIEVEANSRSLSELLWELHQVKLNSRQTVLDGIKLLSKTVYDEITEEGKEGTEIKKEFDINTLRYIYFNLLSHYGIEYDREKRKYRVIEDKEK